MRDDEFVTLENGMRTYFRRLGVPELGNPEQYRRRMDDGSSGELLPLRERVVAQLEALERLFMTYDRHVHDNALAKIRDLLHDAPTRSERTTQFPKHAVVIFEAELGEGMRQYNLVNLPKLKRLRGRVGRLIRRLLED